MSLIKREDLIDHLNSCIAESDGETPITDAVLVAIKCAVEQMPEVDAVPVVHGEWKVWSDDNNAYDCSVCGTTFVLYEGTPTDNDWNYCPNCGAKMDEGGRRCD